MKDIDSTLAPMVAVGLLIAALGCREDAESPTAPEPAPALAASATQALAFYPFPPYPPFLALPFFQNGRATTSACIPSPRHSTSNLVPTLAAAAGKYVVPIGNPSDGLMVPLRTMSTSRVA
jgi:hypothetical protein